MKIADIRKIADSVETLVKRFDAHVVRSDSLGPEDETKFRVAWDELRKKFDALHYLRVDYEKKARILRKNKDPQEEAAWALATKISQEEHSAKDQMTLMKQHAKRLGVRL